MHYTVRLKAWGKKSKITLNDARLAIIAVNLASSENISALRTLMKTVPTDVSTVFLVNRKNRSETIQAGALGAKLMLERTVDPDQLIANVVRLLATSSIVTKKHEIAEAGAGRMSDMMDEITRVIRSGERLSSARVNECADGVIETVATCGVDTMLEAIRKHHSFTYRHCMIVTTFATALGVMYNLRQDDINRLTVGSLLHDVGKHVISPKILDKPGDLTESEAAIMRRHPVDGAALLKVSGDFDQEVIDIARSHHELLDGSGYPDGLQGMEVPDIVRVVTVVDIFAALIEARSYKNSLSAEKAYEKLEAFGRKLDTDIVRAFRPVALSSENDSLISRLKMKFAA
ncbi:MAG: HD domain-containing phosphohydrolase [Pseudomonadota bacterium]